MVVVVSSPSFQHEQAIPRRYTGEGEDVSPSLEWRGVPGNAVSLALLVEDPDAPDPQAPERVYTHWLVFNLPPDVTGLAEAADELPGDARQGLNDFGELGYRGPCPPTGRHHYHFRVFVLDQMLDLERPGRDEFLRAIDGHVLDEGDLVGTYEKGAEQRRVASA